MEVDLNREPLYQIEEQVRRLDAVICWARQRERRQQGYTPIQINNFLGEVVATDDVQDEGRVQEGEVGVDVEEEMVEGEKLGKMKATNLIAKALRATYTNGVAGCKGNFLVVIYAWTRQDILFRHAAVTCFVGHAFIRYRMLMEIQRSVRFCRGEVTEEGIIPIYGNESVDISGQLELRKTGLGVPTRPRACRVENIEEWF